MNTLEIITLATAVVGAITGIGGLWIGIKNHRHNLREARTKLRVLPMLAFPGPMDEMVTQTYYSDEVESALKRLKAYLCIEVKNLSATPQTILEVGIISKDGKKRAWRETELVTPSRHFPLTLEPDETGKAFLRIFPEDYATLNTIVYARTDCGECFKNESPILTDFLERLEEEQPGVPVAVGL